MPRRLIINADDFGVSEDINDGIIECFTRGAVTDFSMLACGGAFRHAAGLMRRHNVKKTGLHLALTGRFGSVSVMAAATGVSAKNGLLRRNFREFLTDFYMGKIRIDGIAAELRAQVVRIKKAGFRISHIDSHEHIHVFSPVLKIVKEIAVEEGIKSIRFPLERVGPGQLIAEPVNAARHAALRFVCLLSKNAFKSPNLRYNNYFLGQFHAHNLKRKDFFYFLDKIKDGLTELGCHPGYFGTAIAQRRPWYKGCEEELKVLCGKEFREAIKAKGVELVSWGL